MANVFIDANIFIDWVEDRRDIQIESLGKHALFISPLSIHILTYLYKYKMPSVELSKYEDYLRIVPLDKNITYKALTGPTKDFEDNVQLHSAVTAECDYFLTSDEELLKTKFFGKAQIVNEL